MLVEFGHWTSLRLCVYGRGPVPVALAAVFLISLPLAVRGQDKEAVLRLSKAGRTSVLSCGEHEVGELIRKRVTLLNDTQQTVRAAVVSKTQDVVVLSSPAKGLEPGQQAEIDVAVIVPMKSGEFSFPVEIKLVAGKHHSEVRFTGRAVSRAKQNKTTDSKGTDAEPFYDTRVVDLGTVWQGKPVRHRFEVQNTGSKPLKIHKVEACCGARAIPPASKTIAPRGKATVTVEVRSSRVCGRIAKCGWVFFEGGRRPLRLWIKAFVKPEFRLSSKRLSLGAIPYGKIVKRSVRIDLLRPGDHTLTPAPHPDERVKLSLTRLPLDKTDSAAHRSWRLDVHVAGGQPLGRIREEIDLRTSSENTPALHISLAGEVAGDLSLSQEEVLLGFVRPGENSFGTVDVEFLSQGVTVTKVTTESPIVAAELTEPEGVVQSSGTRRQVVVRMRPGNETPKGPFRSYVVLSTTGTPQTIRIPVIAHVQR